jgi:hypothetical protein
VTPEELQCLQAIHTNLDALTALRERFVPLISAVNVQEYERYRKTTPTTKAGLLAALFDVIRQYLAESDPLWQLCWDL